jgi:hypothetical protein
MKRIIHPVLQETTSASQQRNIKNLKGNNAEYHKREPVVGIREKLKKISSRGIIKHA